jgi:hypothetical protein
MLDPLQNLLDRISVILWARSEFKNPDRLTVELALVGECDHLAEIRRQMEEVKRNGPAL